jgi:uncharacterized membrane protein
VIAATVNRWISYALLVGGAALIAFGAYLGLFAWMNDGLIAGIRLFGTSAVFGAGLAVTGFAFRFAATGHAKGESRRWWIQALVVAIGYVVFGLAAWSSSLLDRM